MRPTGGTATVARTGLGLSLMVQLPLYIVLFSSLPTTTLAFPISVRLSLPDLSDLPEQISAIIPDIPNPLSTSIPDDDPEPPSSSASPPSPSSDDILSSQSVLELPPPGQLILSQSHMEIFPLSCSVTPIGGGGMALHWRQRDGSCKSTQETNVRGLFMFVLDKGDGGEEEWKAEGYGSDADSGEGGRKLDGKVVWVRDEEIRVWDH